MESCREKREKEKNGEKKGIFKLTGVVNEAFRSIGIIVAVVNKKER